MVEKTVPAKSDTSALSAQEELRAPERYVTPPVDIFETPDGLVVVADLPGVENDGLAVRVDDDILTIQARPRVGTTGEELHREYALKDFFRQFELTDAVDQERISASLQHGVLSLTLPKAERAKPRRIPVQTA